MRRCLQRLPAGAAIRPAAPADARGIARVHVETWRSAYPGILPDKVMVGLTVDQKASDWRRRLEAPREQEGVLVAAIDGEVVGFAGFGRVTGSLAAGEVFTLYVLSDWQDQGLGRALLAGAFARLAQAGAPSALIWVLAENPARFFYEAMGGTKAGARDEQAWGARLHEYAYLWPDLAGWVADQGGGACGGAKKPE